MHRIFILFTLLFNFNYAFSQWTPTEGPTGGEAYDIFNIDNDLFVSLGNGGIYKSTNNGDSWEWSSNGFPCDTGVTAFFEHNGILYVSLWYNGIYMSSNRGASWEPINTGIEGLSFYDIFVIGNEIYAAFANGGVYYSPDNGQSWVNKSSGISNIQFDDIISYNSKIYAGGVNLYESSDNGDTWNLVNVPELTLNGARSLFVHNGVFYIGGDGYILVSRDDMATWEVFNVPYPRGSVSNFYSFDNNVYFTNANGRYFHSNDNGQTWVEVNNQEETSSFIRAIYITGDKIITTTANGIYESYDDGISWIHNNSGIKANNIISLGKNNNYVFTGTVRNGMFRSSDNGLTWEPINNGFHEDSTKSIPEIVVLGDELFITTDYGIYYSPNNGDLWEGKFDLGGNDNTGTIDYFNGTLLTSVGLSLYFSTDNGETWNERPNNLNNPNRGFHCIVFNDNIIAGFDGEEIYVSVDIGSNFVQRNIPNGYAHVYDLDIINDRLYACTSRGFFYSDNLGVTWSQLHNEERTFTDMVIDSGIIYASTEDGIYVTTEDDNKWYPACEGIGKQWTNKIIKVNDTFLAGTYNSSIWQSSKQQLDAVLNSNDQIQELKVCSGGNTIDLTEALFGSALQGGTWNPSLVSGTNIFDPSQDQSGLYEYRFSSNMNFCECEVVLKIDVEVTEELSAGEDTDVEVCSSSSSVDLLDYVNGEPDGGGHWTPALNSGTSVFTPSVDPVGVYTYTVTSPNCNTSSSEITVSLKEEIVISDYQINTTDFNTNNTIEILINSSAIFEYSIDGVNYQLSNKFNNLGGGNYTVYVREVGGCESLEEQVQILDVPKFFTPNNDGYNDIWQIRGSPTFNYHIWIFDRYGKLLRQLDPVDKGWDGTYNGYALPATDYWYKIYFEDGSYKSGHFALKR